MKLKNLNTKTGYLGRISFISKIFMTFMLMFCMNQAAKSQAVTVDFVWVGSTANTADFDVVITNTGTPALKFNSLIVRGNHNASITSGTISWTALNNNALAAWNVGAGAWPNNTVNLPYTAGSRLMNYSSSPTFFTSANAPTIPTTGGVNIGRFRMATTTSWTQNAQFGFVWAATASVVVYVGASTTTTALATAGTNITRTVSASQLLNVSSGPTASVLSGSDSICSGETVNLSVAVTGGTSPYTVTVTDGTSSFTATGSSPVSIPVTPSSTSTYSISSVTGGGTGTGNTGSATITVTPSSDNVTTVSQCGGTYTWADNGQTYTASGIYTGSTTNCVTEKLNLTITTPSDNVTTVSQCGGTYTWAHDGQTYTTSGIYTGTTTNCVTEKLNLTITAPTTNGSVTQSQCGGTYTWAENGQTYSTSGTYTNTVGCNTATLNLTINGGGMALTTSGSSVVGTSSATVNLNNNSTLVIDSSCNYIATVTDGPSGNGAGAVSVGVVVGSTNPLAANGQVYTRRSFDINAATAEAGSVTFYLNQNDFATYNATAGTLLQMSTSTVKIAQVIGGLSGTITPLATTATFDANLNHFEISANVSSLTGSYYFYTDPACTLTMSAISAGTMTPVTSNSTYKVPLSWTAVAGATSYDVRFRKVGTTTWSSFATTNTSRLLVGLLSSSTYEFQGKVRCSNAASGLWGTLGTFTTPAPLVVCTSPTTLNVSNVTAASASFSWTAAGTPTTSYLLRYREVGTTTWQNCGVTTTSRVIGGLTPGTNYEAQVASYCQSINAFGAYTPLATFTTVSAPSCSAPTNFAFVSSTGSTATVSWTNSTGPTKYVVSIRVAGSTSSYLNYSGTSNPRHMGGLTPNTQYEAYLRGYCAATNQFTTASALINFNTGALSKSPAFVEYPEGVSHEVKVYPNPTSDELYIEMLSDIQSTTSIKVMDMSGRVVKQAQSTTFDGLNTIKVSLSELTAGMYTIQVVTNDKLMHVGRINKN